MPAPAPATSSVPSPLVPALLDLSLAGTAALVPVRDEADVVVDFTFQYLNPAAQQLLGLSALPAATFAGQFPQAVHNGALAFLGEAYRRAARAERTVPLHAGGPALHLAAQRHEEYLLVSLAAAEGSGQPEEVRASEARELAAYGEAVRQREQLYHVLEQAPAMICVFSGPEHVFQFVNPSYQALVGERSILGLPVREAMPELADQSIFSLLDQVYQTGETFYAHEMLVQLDHQNDGRRELEKHYYNFIYQARHNPAGAVDGIFVFAYDVTPQAEARRQVQFLNEELHAANEELHTANEELQAANEELITNNNEVLRAHLDLRQLAQELEMRVAERTRVAEQAQARAEQQRAELNQLIMQAPAAICVLQGPEWEYQLVNPGYQQAFPGRALLGKPLLEALPELRDSVVPGILMQVYATGADFQAQELPLRLARVEGGRLEDTHWNFTYQARRDAHGAVDGVMVFAYDVTEQVRSRRSVEANQRQTQALVDELAQANLRLTRANHDLDSFVHTASHDLKAPITNIEGLLQALRQELTLPTAEADVETVLSLMEDSVSRFQRTIKYLTDVTRLQQAPEQPVAPVPLADLVDDVCLDLAPLLAVSGGQVALSPDSCETITFPEKNLRSIVYNLVSNALKYRAPGRPPRVLVRCGNDETGAAVLEVQDNGIGLTNEQRRQVFGMFQRLHDHVEGSGIGLFLVKKVVENAGGRVSVASEPGQGSTFRAVLPQGGGGPRPGERLSLPEA